MLLDLRFFFLFLLRRVFFFFFFIFHLLLLCIFSFDEELRLCFCIDKYEWILNCDEGLKESHISKTVMENTGFLYYDLLNVGSQHDGVSSKKNTRQGNNRVIPFIKWEILRKWLF